MTYFILRNIPALAYSSTPAALSSCRLVIKYSEARRQAAILLYFFAHIHGFQGEQRFVLTYEPNNLGTSFLRPATEELSQTQRSQIARNNTPAAITLSLTLRKPCPVQCPPSIGLIAPKSGHEAHWHQLRDLARGTEIRIVFDDNYVHVNSRAAFHRLIYHPENLLGIPAENYQREASRQADWTIFSPIEDAVPEAPPSYTDVPTKRYKRAALTPSPSKRKRTAPSRIETVAPASPNPLVGSPTEKATTTTASPSPKPPSSPYNAPDLQDVVRNAIETTLPQALQKILPSVLSDLFAASSSPNSDHDCTTSIGARISARIAADVESRLKEKLKEAHADAADDALGLRQYADLKFYEEIENYMVEMSCAKEEGLAEIRHEFETITQELMEIAKEKVVKLGEEVQELADQSYVEVLDKLNELVEKKKSSLQKYAREIPEREKTFEIHTSGGRRAISLPL